MATSTPAEEWHEGNSVSVEDARLVSWVYFPWRMAREEKGCLAFIHLLLARWRANRQDAGIFLVCLCPQISLSLPFSLC